MEIVLIVLIGVIIILLIKLIVLKKSVRDIRSDFSLYGKLDTNTLMGVSCGDKQLRLLVSDLNKTLKTLRESYHMYSSGDRELKTAITNMAHDLRTPLTAILGYIELAERTDMSEDVKKYMGIIKERALHMKKLTEELFEYSVITTEEIKEEKSPVFVNKVLEDCIMNYYPALMEKGIEVSVDITEERIERLLYPSYVERIFTNLISNGLKYSDGDLNITLTDDKRAIFTNKASSLSLVSVGRLFDRFYTVDTARKDSSGLGLSIVRTFAERMDCPVEARYEDQNLIIEIKF
ncbi:MAG: HAMP domain-containing histidine kinase [Lachnospiraceae bacterium]|nr:HAMP domain-containing histidine kinase [Lachnospiraceae bacterium]